MELKPDEIDLIERYSRGELTSGEAALLKEKLLNEEFKNEFTHYLNSIDVVRQAGRMELKQALNTIHNNLESKNEFDRYKPSKKGGSGSSGFMTAIVLTGLIVAGYFIWKSPAMQEYEKRLMDDTPDTIYHYNVVPDPNSPKENSEGHQHVVKKTYEIRDTVYVRDTIRKIIREEGSDSK